MTGTEVKGVARGRALDADNFLKRAYDRYFKELKRRLRAQRFDAATAEDLAQSVFLKLAEHKSPETIRNTEDYIYGIARNVAADLYKTNAKQSRICELSEEMAWINGHGAMSPEDDAIQRDVLQQLHAVVDRLPKRRREVLLLSRFLGYDHAEIAAKFGISKSTVAHHLFLALRDCKAAMKEAGVSLVNGEFRSSQGRTRVDGGNERK